MNNVEDVLHWADNLIFNDTGEHLTPIQEAILTGVWQRQKYPQIAKNYNCGESHIKKEAAKLWEKLREELGEDLNKFNFRSKLEKKYRVSNISHLHDSLLQIDNVICGQFIQTIRDTQTRSHSPPNSPQNQNPSPIIDIADAPELTNYYDRTSELSTLKQWILAQTRLITIYGLSEIGKSAIAVKLIEQIQTQFDYIIWRSISNATTLSALQTDLKQFFSQSQQTPLPTVIDYFRSYRCLVILDDVQNIFRSGQLAGQYLAGYEDYGKFFKQIATSSHQSCLILLSWEKPREITTLEGENRPTKTLHLKGLGEQAEEILREKGLTDEEQWSELITLYQGHPSWLNIIAATIQELFNGSVSLFLAEQNEIFLGDLEPLLESHLERLSETEKQVSYWLASQAEAVDISQQTDGALSKSEILQAIQSLARRGLVEKVQVGTRSHFQIDRIFKPYIARD
ncbi:NB-ARC domain-containing protein [Argonema antarcticum]|uniref:NB-ARC domain-containing protein n=1 Tax=Argonema antarcticum TaxID=2942763 RepID=UPI0020131797|nr:NB-ARC domain-containing protein [Argonema antarcticum]MCL1474337.1 ATPase [Argonema antarcticum A004/B2]